MSQRPSSINRRLFIATLLAMPLLLAVTGIAIERAHHSSLLQAERDRLQLQFFGLLGAIEWQGDSIEMADRLKEPRFWQFRSGLYAEIQSAANKHSLWRSLSAETLELPVQLPSPEPGKALFGDTEIGQQAFFYYRYLAIWQNDDGKQAPLLISLYSQQGPLVAELHQFRRQLTLWLGLVLLFSMALSSLLLLWGLKPLRELANDVLKLEQGESTRLDKPYPRELASLTDNLNQLLESEQRQRERYRNTLGDLAHSLKTPLAVLKSEPDDPSVRQQQLERMENIISYQLNRAVAGSDQRVQSRLTLLPLLESLRNSLLKVYHQKALSITLDIPADAEIAMDQQDLLELFGNLLDNACKACRREVRLSLNKQHILIDDDGVGINPQQAEQLLDRGRRGDQYGQGQGLGLAIVREIIDSYGAEIRFQSSPLGGCRVVLEQLIRH